MNASQPIIDVTPIEHSSNRSTNQHASSQSAAYRQPSWTASSGSTGTGANYNRIPSFDTTYVYDTAGTATASKTGSSALVGLAQIAAGAGLVMIGIPMLILPGPGLISIAGGFALALSGTRKLFS